MKRLIQQMSILIVQSVCSAGMLFAEQRVRPGDDARLQAQFLAEQQELQQEMENLQRENRHRVTDPSVHALELRRAEKRDDEAMRPTSVSGNTSTVKKKAQMQLVLKEFNEQLPEINRALKQASSNSPLPVMEFKPLTSEAVRSPSKKNGVTVSASQLASRQMVMKQIQQEMEKASPEDRKQLKAVLSAIAQEKKLPLPSNLPLPQKSQLFLKGER